MRPGRGVRRRRLCPQPGREERSQAGEEAARRGGRACRPEQHERHHAMRIAAKRLRYTLELARPVYSGDLADIWRCGQEAQRCWARSTIATFGSRLSPSSPGRNRRDPALLRWFAAVRAFAARPGLSSARSATSGAARSSPSWPPSGRTCKIKAPGTGWRASWNGAAQ